MNVKAVKVTSLSLGLMMAIVHGVAPAESVTEAWEARYNGSGNGKDNAQALMLDNAGNAYVTGFSDSGGGNYDFATVKYDSDGKQLWVARYNGESSGADWVDALALDSMGNVLVTGSSAGSGTDFDFATVKYDAQGRQLWVRRYDGPVHGPDRVKGMAVDAAGNVYVVGDSSGHEGRAESATLKYGSDGDLLWAARSSESDGGGLSLSAIAVDSDGNVYVAGRKTQEAGNSDFVTIKYDSDGNRLWTAYRDWGANDDARFLTLDSQGHAYVAGSSLRYAQDPGKTAHEDVALVKYAHDGKELWTASFNGGSVTDDVASAMRIDLEGHVYVTATSYGEMSDGSSADFTTLKYDSDGRQLWSAPYQGIGETADAVYDAILDSSGAVYVLGYERGGPDRESWLITLKFDADGNGQWVMRHEGMATAGAGALAVDDLGAVWISGSDTAGRDYLTLKFRQSALEAQAAEPQKQGHEKTVE